MNCTVFGRTEQFANVCNDFGIIRWSYFVQYIHMLSGILLYRTWRPIVEREHSDLIKEMKYFNRNLNQTETFWSIRFIGIFGLSCCFDSQPQG